MPINMASSKEAGAHYRVPVIWSEQSMPVQVRHVWTLAKGMRRQVDRVAME